MVELESTQSKVSTRAPEGHGGFLYDIWEIIKVILISLAIVLPIRYYIAQPFIVRGSSMEPTFHNREYLIVDEISYYFGKPKRGDVIVFRFPRDPRQFFIKRIVGLPEEKVEIKNGRIKIFNSQYPAGFVLEESYLSPPDRPTWPDITTELREKEYFVLGDNRDFSSDSRVWGVLADKFIVGETFLRVWPLTDFGLVGDLVP